MARWLALLWLGVAFAAQAAPPPESWVDAGRALPLEVGGRVMPLQTWATVQKTGVRDLLLAVLAGAEFPTGSLIAPRWPREVKERAAGLYLYWLDRSRAEAWQEAAETMSLLADTLSAARGPLPLATWEAAWGRVPFSWLALAAGVLGLGLGFRWRPGLGWGAALVVLLTSVDLGLRMLITGHPPVTTLATTFVFVSWLAAALALGLGFRSGVSGAVRILLGTSAVLPLLSLAVVAPGDPYAPVQAVLNTSFWLAVHVPTIASGYAVSLLAGLTGHAYLVVAGRKKGGSELLPLWQTLRISLLAGLGLTLAGTLLGGFWADQSWGRFWGWDPKENGALLLVLWLALSLHLKPAGWAAEWGTALAASFLIPVLLFSWLGVNLLGQGFHSYGALAGKTILFLGLLTVDFLFLAFLIVRRVLR